MSRGKKPGRGLLSDLFARVRNEEGKTVLDIVAEGVSPDAAEELERTARAELDNPPRIAIIGKTGAGKSSTLNALFGLGLKVGHVEATTQEEHEISIVNGTRGSLIIYDMPGLAEDIDADEKHKETYARVLTNCDVAVWIIKADDRAMAYDQLMLRDVVRAVSPKVASRLVVGINQVDLIQPGHWIEEANYPSETQLESIKQKIADVQKKVVKVCPSLTPKRIVAYSALRRFRLEQLFAAMTESCANNRAWVLTSRKAVADFAELITDPEMKQFVSDQRTKRSRR